MTQRRAFSLVEILIVVMLMSAGILPIYSLIKGGQKRIVRADTRTLATLYGSSAIELARTLGYEKAGQLDKEKEFQELCENAQKNGFQILYQSKREKVLPSPPGAQQQYLLRVDILVKAINRVISDVPELNFTTIITDPRVNFY
ncbi:MAG TPA: hypothetical protein PKO06_13230 [Candidatus Ozemobacteraceae bacterium]|nr:hypothetical protein [Candidatus Ozemobacteraceae bacterium]